MRKQESLNVGDVVTFSRIPQLRYSCPCPPPPFPPSFSPHSSIRGSYIFHLAFPSLSQRPQISLLNNQSERSTRSFLLAHPYIFPSTFLYLPPLLFLQFASPLHLHCDSYSSPSLSTLFVSFHFVRFARSASSRLSPATSLLTQFHLHLPPSIPPRLRSSIRRATSLLLFASAVPSPTATFAPSSSTSSRFLLPFVTFSPQHESNTELAREV